MGFTSQDNTSSKNTTLYHYGNSSGDAGLQDYIYTAESVESQYARGVVTNANYRLGLMKALVMNKTTIGALSDFLPVDSIARKDADVYFFFLSGNEVKFTQFTDDEWYRLDPTVYQSGVVGASNNTSADQVYLPMEPASPLWCTDQYQFCNTAYLGPRSLLSQSNLINGFQGPLASNQWQLDVMHCLFGLYFTLILGFLIVLASYLLEPVSAWLHKRKYSQYAHLEWTTNATLQLQRLAHEEIRVGTWSECTDTIPVTKANELLGRLDITDLTHPVLRRPEEIDMLDQAETAHETLDTVVYDAPQTPNTPLATPSPNAAVHSETGEQSAESPADDCDPSPQALGLTTDPETALSGDELLVPLKLGLEHNGHA
ncbi:hypothetical protein HD806DRAFT_537414 [Xylariaceae sp. AK1471]|nr:hypothetical protein HD806DRAFT_537414 [Xylariaceae sp. AK1471]